MSATLVLTLIFWPLALVMLLVVWPQQTCQAADSSTSGDASRAPVTIVGDSLTQGAQAQLQATLTAARIIDKPGMPWSWGLGQIHPRSGDVVAYLLGTNMGATPADVSGLLAANPGVRFVLMTVSVPFGYQAATNAAVSAAAAAHPGVVFVADWHAKVAADPSLVGADHVHPTTAAGWQAFADVVAAAVNKTVPPAAFTSVISAVSVGPSKPGDHHYTQAQMQAAVAKYDPAQAVALGAIAMAETAGWDFPTTNPTGRYHGPWAFQEASNPQLNMNLLDSSLDYAAKAAADLAKTGITHGKWETWPDMAAKFMPGGSDAGEAAAPASGSTSATTVQATTVSCTTALSPGGGGVASANGLTFPLKTTQAAIMRGSEAIGGGWERWCYTSQSNCHHDYNAADIMVPTGTLVLAPVSGTVVNTHHGLGDSCVYDNRGDTLSLKEDGNGMAFFMGHLLTGTLRVEGGDHVTNGEPIGQVGRAAEAQCTVPHLHIQENLPGDYGGQQDPLNVQPALTALFKKLP